MKRFVAAAPHGASMQKRPSSRSSTPVRSVSSSSTGRSCRHCSGRGKIPGGRNSIARRCTRNSRANSSARPLPLPSGQIPAQYCWAAGDSRAGSHSRANAGHAACERARLMLPQAATGERRSIQMIFATYAQNNRPAVRMRDKFSSERCRRCDCSAHSARKSRPQLSYLFQALSAGA